MTLSRDSSRQARTLLFLFFEKNKKRRFLSFGGEPLSPFFIGHKIIFTLHHPLPKRRMMCVHFESFTGLTVHHSSSVTFFSLTFREKKSLTFPRFSVHHRFSMTFFLFFW
jgi:hypothetical protein